MNKNWGHTYEHSILTFETATVCTLLFLKFCFILLDTNQLFINCICYVCKYVLSKKEQEWDLWKYDFILHQLENDDAQTMIKCYGKILRFNQVLGSYFNLVMCIMYFYCNYFIVDKIEYAKSWQWLNQVYNRQNLFHYHKMHINVRYKMSEKHTHNKIEFFENCCGFFWCTITIIYSKTDTDSK